MKKILTTALLIATSFAANADWKVNQNGIGFVLSNTDQYHGLLLTDEYLVVINTSISCDRTPQRCQGESVMKVNGTPVKFVGDAYAGMAGQFAATQEGVDFLLEEFKKSSVVTIGDYSYSAIGFTDTLHKIHSLKSEAL